MNTPSSVLVSTRLS